MVAGVVTAAVAQLPAITDLGVAAEENLKILSGIS
jgi:hypothetical protein